jgi:20S proteasome subunit beta 5
MSPFTSFHLSPPCISTDLHGTTTLAFIFNEGIIVAVDSRASMGSYIGSQSVEKVIKINPYLLGTIAGGAADCQYWQRRLSLQCKLYELREGKRISVAAASKLMGNVVYQYRSHGLSMGMMAAGIDEGSGPQLFYLDSDGSRLKGQRFSVGSGSTFAYGILDNLWRADLTVEEACEVGRRSIYHATRRDAYSGGMINVFYVGPDGWRCVSRDDMDTLHYEKYELEKK